MDTYLTLAFQMQVQLMETTHPEEANRQKVSQTSEHSEVMYLTNPLPKAKSSLQILQPGRQTHLT